MDRSGEVLLVLEGGYGFRNSTAGVCAAAGLWTSTHYITPSTVSRQVGEDCH